MRFERARPPAAASVSRSTLRPASREQDAEANETWPVGREGAAPEEALSLLFQFMCAVSSTADRRENALA
jgi:hypothetical protein